MTHIKKIVMRGFKSFARQTEIVLDRNMNVFIGPNGSGKSNITDAMIFVLGRLGAKTMRAAKSSNLIFTGNKHYKGASEAFVELIFDNSNKTFSLDNKEISIKRILKKNGSSLYKINKETKTRQEVLELLSQAGIDPHGFNIVLQGEIQRFIKMNSEERRKIIEEVAGISVYEMRKEKSLKELEKTHEKLRQINAILRERTNYLKNLEQEREQALRFKKLELTIERCKYSIIKRKIQNTDKELTEIQEKIFRKDKEIEKQESKINKINTEINSLNNKIDEITKTIQKSSGLEQDSLNEEITGLKQETAGLIARKENLENQLIELDRRSNNLKLTTIASEKEIQLMIKEKGKNKKKQLEEKKKKLEQLEETKRDFFLLKSKLTSLNHQIEDRKRQIPVIKNESKIIIDQIEDLEKEIKPNAQPLENLKTEIEKNKNKLTKSEEQLIVNEKTLAINHQIIKDSTNIKSQISKIDICPLCKTKMTNQHIKHVTEDSNNNINKARKIISDIEKEIKKNREEIEKLKSIISKLYSDIQLTKISEIKKLTIKDKKKHLKRDEEKLKVLGEEFKNLEKKRKIIENKLSSIKSTEEDYELLKLEVNELQRSEERNLGMEITARQRELERIKTAIKQVLRDKEDAKENLEEIQSDLEEKEELVEEKELQAETLKKKYEKMYEEKNKIQDKVRQLESTLLKEQNERRNHENDNNNLKIIRAQIQTKKDTYNQEITEFKETEFLNLPIDKLKSRLENAELAVSRIGNVNMRALEVYDGIKEEYDKIREKVEQLEKEEDEILKIIAQIDRKKKKSFIQILEGVNKLFSRNFSSLSSKGIIHLEPQDRKEIFNKGLDIKVRVEGKRDFDTNSLSGGEQTLVALALIFAIQELKPYHFYIFDEIDAALDRRNSEKLAYLLKKNIKDGQYLIITHNDSIISESSNVLYGVSMQEGISKVLSLEI